MGKYQVPEEFKSNYFYKNRKEIQRLSRERNVDVGVALDMFRVDHPNEYTSAELKAWCDMVIRFQQTPGVTLADLFA